MITITIKTDNAAFGESSQDRTYGDEVARIFQHVAQQYAMYGTIRFSKVYDSNGNAVGDVRLTGKDRDL